VQILPKAPTAPAKPRPAFEPSVTIHTGEAMTLTLQNRIWTSPYSFLVIASVGCGHAAAGMSQPGTEIAHWAMRFT
jgi:hypothetical protein